MKVTLIRIASLSIGILMPVVTVAVTVTEGSFSFECKDGTAVVTKYTGTGGHVTLPSTVDYEETEYYNDENGVQRIRTVTHTAQVTVLGDAFSDCSALTSIDLSNIRQIRSGAFARSGLTSVQTASACTFIGNNAFSGCTSLKTASIDGTNLDLSESQELFSGCTALTDVEFGDGVVALYQKGDYSAYTCSMFRGCRNLQTVVVGAGVTEVPEYFSIMDPEGQALRSVTFKGCLTSIGNCAFNAASLREININIAWWCTLGVAAFMDCPAVTFKTLDFSCIGSLGGGTFSGCTNLIGELSLPLVTAVKGCDFERCSGLTGLPNLPNVKSIGIYAFGKCTGLAGELNLSGVQRIDHLAFSGCTGLTGVRTSKDCTTLGNSAFSGCTGLKTAKIEGTNLDLSNSQCIFSGCTALADAEFGDGVVSLYMHGNSDTSGTFSGCPNLQTIVVGTGVSKVPVYFTRVARPNQLRSVTFRGALTEIGDFSFDWTDLSELVLTLADGCAVGQGAFYGCPFVTTANVDFAKIGSLGMYAFDGCTGLAGELLLPQVTTIGPWAFENCAGLTDVKIGAKCTSLGSGAFSGCTSLANCTFMCSVPTLEGTGMAVFNKCPATACGHYDPAHAAAWQAAINPDTKKWQNLAMEQLPQPDFSFLYFEDTGHAWVTGYNGTDANVRIPATVSLDTFGAQTTDMDAAVKSYVVTGIEDEAFAGNEVIKYLTIPDTVTSLGACAFTWCPNLREVEVSAATALSAGCFAYDVNLERVVIGDKVTSLLNTAQVDEDDFAHASPFLGCEKLRSVQVGSGVTELPSYVFNDLAALEFLRLKAPIGEVGARALSGCVALTSLDADFRPHRIGDGAFFGVPAAFFVDMTECTGIGTSAFHGCCGFFGSGGSTHTLDLPAVTVIDDDAFGDCPEIVALRCGENLEMIGDEAFRGSGLAAACFLGMPPSVGTDAFSDLPTTAEGNVTLAHASEWRTVIDANGLWHGIHFSIADSLQEPMTCVYTIKAIGDETNAFASEKVTAVIHRLVKGAGGRATFLTVGQRDCYGFDTIVFPIYGEGEYEITFEYEDASWVCTMDSDRFSFDEEQAEIYNREETVYFRFGNPPWSLTVYLYAHDKAQQPFAVRTFSSEAGVPGLEALAPAYVPYSCLPMPDWPARSDLPIMDRIGTILFAGWCRRHPPQDAGQDWTRDTTSFFWLDENGSPVSFPVGQSETDAGLTLHLVATWTSKILVDDENFGCWEDVSSSSASSRTIKSKSIADGESADCSLTLDESESGGVLSFYWQTSSESKATASFCDHAEFLVDGEVVATCDGESLRKKVSVSLSGGQSHTVTWRYVKDGSGCAGEDCVWVSDIRFAGIADEETATDLPDAADCNWFYEDAEMVFSVDKPFVYKPRLAPENSLCRIDACCEWDGAGGSIFLGEAAAAAPAGIRLESGTDGFAYRALTTNGWVTVGNAGLDPFDGGESSRISFVVDFAASPATVRYAVAGHTLTNAAGVSAFACAGQEQSVRAISATGTGAIHALAGGYEAVNSDVCEVAAETEIELSENLETFSNETFRVTGGGTLVISADKFPEGGIDRRFHVDENSKVRFDLTGFSMFPTTVKLFNGVGQSFTIGGNVSLTVPGEGVDRVSKLFVKDGNLEARIAERPRLDVGASLSPSSACASVENAVDGFWYGLETTKTLNVDFALDPNSVKQCTGSGTMVLESSATADSSSGFYRVRVSGDAFDVQ